VSAVTHDAAVADVAGLGVDELRAEYAAYRRRQARALVRLLPREAVRPLYRRALQAGGSVNGAADPLGALVGYCERLLPLPPFERWLEDRRRYPDAHLHDVDDSAEAPTAEAPSTLDVRTFDVSGASWVARLRSFREGVTWKAFIAFERSGSRDVHRTALIFREADPVDVRERFNSFDHAALRAFLRSALP
jgi:hypothetical protein